MFDVNLTEMEVIKSCIYKLQDKRGTQRIVLLKAVIIHNKKGEGLTM